MSVNAVDWALRFAPVDARHNGAARVLMCLANVADERGATRIRRTGSWPRGASAA